MHSTVRVLNYQVNLRQETAQKPVFKELQVNPETGEPLGPLEPELLPDGSPVFEEIAVQLLGFVDQESPNEWLFLADPDFRVELIRICAQGLDESQKQRAMGHLTGGVIVAGADALPQLNRQQRRAAERARR